MFIAQAYKGFNGFGRYFLTLAIVFIAWQFIGLLPMWTAVYFMGSNLSEFFRTKSFSVLEMDLNLLLALLILSFVIGLLGLLFSVKFVHRRALLSVITSRKKIDWNRFLFGFVLLAVFNVTIIIFDIWWSPENYKWNFHLWPFIVLCGISLLLLPLQAAFEELLFRGYLLQAFGLMFKNKWLPLVLTSVTFGLMHWFNPEMQKLGPLLMIFYMGTGLFFGICTLMDEGTELALGLHAANNAVVAILVTTDWTALQTDSLYVDLSEPTLSWDVFLPVIVLYPILIAIFAKKYHWNHWMDKLFGKIPYRNGS